MLPYRPGTASRGVPREVAGRWSGALSTSAGLLTRPAPGWAGKRPDLPDDSSPFPWIEDVEDFLSGLEDQGDVEVFGEGEEFCLGRRVALPLPVLGGVPAEEYSFK